MKPNVDVYMKLTKMLGEREKGVLDGFEHAIQAIVNFKETFDCDIVEDVPILREMQIQIGRVLLDNLIYEMRATADDYMVAFVDNNHYYIDTDGNIVDGNRNVIEVADE